MKLLSTLTLIFSFSIALAQYTTPGTGVDWTLDDVATASPGTVTVSGSTYTLLEDLTIAATDILRINADLTLEIEAGVRVTVLGQGSFFVDADLVLVTAVDEAAPYDGFRFEEFSDVDIQNTTFQFGGGLQVLTETFTLNSCILQNNVSGVTTGATVTLSRGIPVITNNVFLYNANPAISSGGNQSVSAYIFNNYIEGNNQTNNNRPQINMGATRVNDTLKIIQNTIVGDRDMEQAGGIAVANLFGSGTLRAIIEGNNIINNRYGITVVGPNSYALIKDNIIEDNDTQNNPNLGGSGINLNAPTGGMTVDVTGNQIRRNLWGVTIQGPVDANLGDDQDNPGLNVFSDNGNNGDVFALYNNGPNTISAKHNCWVEGGDGTLAEAEDVIFHQVDDPTLGEVVFDPIFCENLSIVEISPEAVVVYPNPADNQIILQNQQHFETITFYNVSGQKVYTTSLNEGTNTIKFDLPAGIYFVALDGGNNQTVKKIVVR